MANIMRLGGGGGGKAPAIFGDGSDGVGLFTSNTTWLADTEDTGMIVKNFERLTISQGVTVSAGNRNCGMIIRVKGDCTIAGSLVNKLSCKTLLDSDGVDFSAYPASMLNGVAGAGGKGGRGTYYYNQAASTAAQGGSGMPGRFYGGGWSGGGGGDWGNDRDRAGKPGQSGNITTADTTTSIPPAGGVSFWGTYRGGNGALGGGVIILLVGGKLTITGTIDCSGNNGGNQTAQSTMGTQGGGGGGGAGGGRIFICHKGDISNSGTLNVNGGAAGLGHQTSSSANSNSENGVAGGIGTTAVKTYKQYMEEDVA